MPRTTTGVPNGEDTAYAGSWDLFEPCSFGLAKQPHYLQTVNCDSGDLGKNSALQKPHLYKPGKYLVLIEPKTEKYESRNYTLQVTTATNLNLFEAYEESFFFVSSVRSSKKSTLLF